jgi:FtsP/CotA-like multicopper oxidase with cupredoxin domain
MYKIPGQPASIPGPTLEMNEGDQVCVEFRNYMDEHSSVHFHGIKAPFLANDTDGVPPVGAGTDIPNNGSPLAVHFTAPKPGAFMYHAHENTTRQILLGLYGRIIVKSKHHQDDDQYAYDDTWMLSEWRVNKNSSNIITSTEPSGLDIDALPNYFIINGKAFNPYTIGSPNNKIVALKPGQKARIRLIGMGQWAHPMHMHGRNFRVTAQDGVPIPVGQQRVMNTLTVHPGEIWDIEFTAGTTTEDLGIWVFHCHVLDHATNNDVYPGGLVSAIAIVP